MGIVNFLLPAGNGAGIILLVYLPKLTLMKHFLLLAACSVLLWNNANAKVAKILPKFTVGVKAGANFQTLSGKDWESSYKPGILGGAFVGVTKGKWGIQAEGLVKSARFDYKATSGYFKTVGVDVPLLLEYNPVWRLWIQAGPQYSMVLSAKDDTKKDVKDYLNAADISGVVGIQVNLPLRLSVGARYIMGFSDMNSGKIPTAADAWRNRYAQVFLGFRFL